MALNFKKRFKVMYYSMPNIVYILVGGVIGFGRSTSMNEIAVDMKALSGFYFFIFFGGSKIHFNTSRFCIVQCGIVNRIFMLCAYICHNRYLTNYGQKNPKMTSTI
jgi:intracellular septation protein A